MAAVVIAVFDDIGVPDRFAYYGQEICKWCALFPTCLILPEVDAK